MSSRSLTSPARRRRRLLTSAAAASTLLLAACGANDAGGAGGAEGGALSFATGPTAGVYYPYGGGIATVIGEQVEGYTATIQETNASVDNMLLIGEGTADLALVLGDTAAAAVEGVDDFDGSPIEACALGKLYNNVMQPITTTGTGITTVEDMRGGTISLGPPGSGTEVIALRILEQAGIDPDADITRQQLDVGETVEALRDGTIDAGFWSGGLPTGALVDLAGTGEMVLIPTDEYAEAMGEEFGDYYFADEIPADTYEGQTEAVPQLVTPNLLMVGSDMPEELQRSITEAVFENKEQLITVHPAAEELDPATAGDISFVDVCPGAAAYFDEAAG